MAPLIYPCTAFNSGISDHIENICHCHPSSEDRNLLSPDSGLIFLDWKEVPNGAACMISMVAVGNEMSDPRALTEVPR